MTFHRVDIYEVAALVGPAMSGRRRFGVPPGGPVDVETWEQASEVDGVAWELFGIAVSHWEVEKAGSAVVVGGERKLLLNAVEISQGSPFYLEPGDVLRIEPVRPGQVAYLGSCVTLENLVASEVADTLRIWPSIDGIDQVDLFDRDFSISIQSSRVGFRLNERIEGQPDLPNSEPTTPGVIQVTPGGELIIMGPDGPTIGGYRRIGAVVEEDLPKLGRIGFERPLRFAPR